MRKIIYDMLVADTELQALVGDRWIGSTGLDGVGPGVDLAVGVERPFGTYRLAGTFLGVGSVSTMRLEVWIHQEPGNYDTCDAALRRVKDLLEGAPQKHNPETGVWFQEASWIEYSPDLYDDARRTNTKMAAFTVVGSGV